jgi:hypothetical protein
MQKETQYEEYVFTPSPLIAHAVSGFIQNGREKMPPPPRLTGAAKPNHTTYTAVGTSQR